MTNGDVTREFEFKVNGTQFATKQKNLTAREILELAASKGAIPGKPDEYELEGDKGRYKGSDVVNLAEDNIFITIPISPTPVA